MVLPVQFIDVSAMAIRNEVKLKWSTASETGLKNYVVERSTDGRNFSEAAIVPANNSATGSAYQWTDAQPNEGINYYRINSTGINGIEKYSEIVTVKFHKSAAVQGITIVGNTIKNNLLTLQLNDVAVGPYQLKLYNMQGQLLEKFSLQHNGGANIQSFVIGTWLPFGKYQLQLTGKLVNFSAGIIKE
jgi:hypothetical protein